MLFRNRNVHKSRTGRRLQMESLENRRTMNVDFDDQMFESRPIPAKLIACPHENPDRLPSPRPAHRGAGRRRTAVAGGRQGVALVDGAARATQHAGERELLLARGIESVPAAGTCGVGAGRSTGGRRGV